MPIKATSKKTVSKKSVVEDASKKSVVEDASKKSVVEDASKKDEAVPVVEDASKKDEAVPVVEVVPVIDTKALREKAIRDANNAEMKAAKRHLVVFQDTPEFSKLPEDVQFAIKRVCGKVRVVSARDVFADTLSALFLQVGDSVAELDIFLKTKMGRGEFRKRVRESLKKADPAKRMWVEFNEEEEAWELLAIGEALPTGFRGAAIDTKPSIVKERSRD